MDETETLRRIIADCVANELRWADPPGPEGYDLHRLGDRVANEVIRRIESAGIKAVSP